MPLPGLNAQRRMSPSHRAFYPSPEKNPPYRGAVLILLYPKNQDNQLFVVLTVRSENVSVHKGQVSLPGGSYEPADITLVETAIRETREELGIHGEDLRILGALTPIYIEPSHFDVHPFVGYLPYRPCFASQTGEVAEVVEVPLKHFLDDTHVKIEEWIIEDVPRRIPYFNVSGRKVWGATAIILAEFAAILSLIKADQ
jgi:8-oxo-dGTP pyrophosphatase MutT (NUDIX family)